LRQKFFDKIIFFLFALAVSVLPMVFVPWIRLEFELPKAAVFKGIAIAIWAVLIIKILIEKKIGILGLRGWVGKAFWTGILGFVLALAVASMLSWAPWVSFFGSYLRQQGFLQFLFYILFFFAGVLVFEKKDFVRLFRYIGFGAVLVCVIAVMQRLFGGIDYRIFGTMGHPNFLGSYLVIAIPFLVGNCINGVGRGARFFWSSCVILALITLFLTFSRAAILGLFVEILLMILIFWRTEIWKKITMILIGIVAFSGIFAGSLFFAGEGSSFARLSGSGEGGVAVSTRLAIWPWAVEMVLERPVFGYGPEMFQELFERKAPESFWDLENGGLGSGKLAADRAHNELLDIAASSGLVGLLAYLCVFFCVLKIAWRGRGDVFVSAGFVSLISLFVVNMFGFSTTVHYVLWWAIAAMIVVSGGGKEILELKFLKNLNGKILAKIFVSLAVILTVFVSGWVIFNFSFRPILADYKYMQAANEVFAWRHLEASNDFKEVLRENPYEVFYAISAAEHALLAYEDVRDNEKSLILGNAEFFINYAKILTGASFTKVAELEKKLSDLEMNR
jgi:putative inorganic carbon (HCO3(-)) transporter